MISWIIGTTLGTKCLQIYNKEAYDCICLAAYKDNNVSSDLHHAET